MSAMEFRHDLRHAQSLSPRLQHAVRLLQMSSMDFSATVNELLGRNPFLESEEGEDVEPGHGAAPDPGLEADAGRQADDTAASESPLDRELWQTDVGASLRRADDGEMSALDRMAVDTTLAAHLHGQVRLLAVPARSLELAHALIDSLDDDGYLRSPLDELADALPLAPAATQDELVLALALVQSLEPAGVGARDVGECLQLQLQALPDPAERSLAQRLVCDHLPRLAARDVPGLALALGEPVARIAAVCERIRRLDPRPGWRHGPSRVAYVVPDVIVHRVRNEWTAQLNPAVMPKVRLNQVYTELFKRYRTAQHADMASQLQEARWMLRNVEQRFSTILDVTEAIVRRQRHFFEFGAMAMKPLGLKEIADEVAVHESTVSRVTNNKYMSTPLGVFELKFFFSRAMVSANGSACSGTAIRGLVKDIIEAECPERPWSDAEITRQLVGQGLGVARRTVTKYRQMLRIEPVDRRRRHA